MAVAFRAGINSGAANTATGRSLVIPATSQVDDIAIFFAEIDAAPAITAVPSGWTQILNVTGTGGERAVAWWKRLVSGDPGASSGTFSWGATAQFSEAALLCWSGVTSAGSPFSGTPVSSLSANGTSSTYTGTTTLDPNSMVIITEMEVDVGNSPTSTDGTKRNTQTSISVWDAIQASAGATGTKSVTGRTTTNTSEGFVFALNGGPPGVTTQTSQFNRMRVSRQYL